MKHKRGFTLIELLVALLIFGFMISALTSIYATATRHMYQEYRQNVLKINTLIAMRTIQHDLRTATRLDYPAFGSADNEVAFAANVDHVSGCYPVSATSPSSWHKFCYKDGTLYHYYADIPASGPACGTLGAPIWTGPQGGYPPCGSAGNKSTRVILLEKVSPTVLMFSRAGADKICGKVDVNLRVFWSPPVTNNAQRNVDHTLSTSVTASMPCQ